MPKTSTLVISKESDNKNNFVQYQVLEHKESFIVDSLRRITCSSQNTKRYFPPTKCCVETIVPQLN